MAAVLLEAGADPNLKTAAELTPIVIAIHRNSPDVLELLANHPKIDLCSPVRYLCNCIIIFLLHQN